MQQGSDSTNYLARLVTDKECKNNLPTFIDIEKYFFQPQQDKLNTTRSTQMHIDSGHETFTVKYTCKEQATTKIS